MSNSSSEQRKRVLSGMRPTGKLHLGNYMGALYNWVRLQHQYECYFFIADWHALTTDYADPSQIKSNTIDVALDWLAAGLDPEMCTIFIQSHVPEHAELHLLFSMTTPLGWLERVPTYKEQIENIKGRDLATYGFLGYPLLQAADILLYQADFVPVGQDQVAHVELTREVARRFNSMYRTEIFPEPEALLTPSPKLPGTDGRKMSKSYGNTIGLTEPPAVVASKVHSMSTNGQRVSQSDPGDPDLCPVGDLHKIFSSEAVIGETQEGCRTARIRCEICKAKAAISVCDLIEPIFVKRRALENDIENTWEMLRAQSQKATERAEETMFQVRATMNVGRDLGAVKRNFGAQGERLNALYDLRAYSDWWDRPSDQQVKFLRDYWRSNLLPYDIPFRQEANRTFQSLEREFQEPFLTAKQKRVLVTAARQEGDGWHFKIPLKSYEVWELLCWRKEDLQLYDFTIPQSVYSRHFARAKKALKNVERLPVLIAESGGQWKLSFAGCNGLQADVPETRGMDDSAQGLIDITEFLRSYEILK